MLLMSFVFSAVYPMRHIVERTVYLLFPSRHYGLNGSHIIKNFHLPYTLSQDFFIGCNNIVSRRQGLCCGAGNTRAATGESVCIHHPRLRYAHLGLIRFDLFEVVNDGAEIPLQRFCQSTRSPWPASIQDGCVQGMPTCSADAMNRVPTICF